MANTNVEINKLFNTCKFLGGEIMRDSYDNSYKSYFIDKYNDKNCAHLENISMNGNGYGGESLSQFYTPYYNLNQKSRRLSRIEAFGWENITTHYTIAVIILMILILAVIYAKY